MPDYLSPGVYIEEVPGPQPIVAVSTSIAGFLGMTERGPEQVPILCTSIGDYTNWFGGLLNHGDFLDPVDQTRSHCYLPYAVQGFFTNGGQLAYVVRVLPAEATYAHRFLYNRGNPGDLATLLLRTASEGTGTALLPPTICVVDATGVSSTTTLRIGDGSASEYIPVASAATLVDYVVTDQPLALSHAAGAAIHYSSITPGATPFSTASRL